jgi:hypothetical protein
LLPFFASTAVIPSQIGGHVIIDWVGLRIGDPSAAQIRRPCNPLFERVQDFGGRGELAVI